MLRTHHRKMLCYKTFTQTSEFTNKLVISEISGAYGGKYEDECLLGCCAV
jgi:hypothetical protein